MTFHFKSFAARLLCVGGLATALSGCITPLVVGGFVGTTMVASDRRTSGAQLEDQGIEVRGGARIRDQFGSTVHVNLSSYNRQVLITGEVGKAADRQAIEQIVGQVENVKGVVNELAVAPFSTFGERTNDSVVSGKVKASMIDSRDLFASAFKVVTERGIVYLMGRVTAREATRAVEVTRGVNGVQKIVRVFEIISEDELKAMQPAPAPGGAGRPGGSAY